MALVSIIVPVYNVEKYLCSCVDSILCQSFYDLELILVDDGSTDKSFAICKEYEKKDPRVRVFHQENQGQAVARNKALDWLGENSQSSWVMFVDSDDWISEKMVESLLFQAKHDNTKIVIANYLEERENAESIVEHPKLATYKIQTEDFYCNNIDLWAVVPWGKLIAKELVSDIRFPKVRACEDEGFTYKVLFRENEISIINQPLYYYRIRNGSTMNRPWTPSRMYCITAMKERLKFLKKNNFKAAYEVTLKRYLHGTLFDSIVSLEKNGLEFKYRAERKNMKNKLCYELIRYWMVKDVSPYDCNYVRLYEAMFPASMNLYWRIKGIIYKLGSRQV